MKTFLIAASAMALALPAMAQTQQQYQNPPPPPRGEGHHEQGGARPAPNVGAQPRVWQGGGGGHWQGSPYVGAQPHGRQGGAPNPGVQRFQGPPPGVGRQWQGAPMAGRQFQAPPPNEAQRNNEAPVGPRYGVTRTAPWAGQHQYAPQYQRNGQYQGGGAYTWRNGQRTWQGGDRNTWRDRNWQNNRTWTQNDWRREREHHWGWNGRRVDWGAWNWPSGYHYHRYYYGQILPWIFIEPQFYFTDYYDYGFDAPPYGFEWVRYGPDLLLVNIDTGEVVDVEYGVFDY